MQRGRIILTAVVIGLIVVLGVALALIDFRAALIVELLVVLVAGI